MDNNFVLCASLRPLKSSLEPATSVGQGEDLTGGRNEAQRKRVQEPMPTTVLEPTSGSMDLRHLDELALLEDTYWWHVSKRRLVLSILADRFAPPARLIEGGVGGCGNLLAFRDAGYEVTGLDVLPEAIEHGRRRGLKNLYCHDLLQPWPVEEGSFDVAVLLDVLEHVADPVVMLRHACRALRPEGGIVVTVPAYPCLFGPWDEHLGHYRRYTMARLREDADAAGLQVRWLNYWNAFSLPAAIVVRYWQRRRSSGGVEFPRVRPGVNRCLLQIASIERQWLTRWRLPMGLSLVGVLMR
jgi:SAM-dependent methyltransferase